MSNTDSVILLSKKKFLVEILKINTYCTIQTVRKVNTL